MERYEFSEGSSNKFWEVKLEDCSVYTKYGRIGSDGKTTVKEFDDEEKAQKEYDKLVKSKVKKGYVAVGAAKATKKKVAKKKVAKKKVVKKKAVKKKAVKKKASSSNGDYTRYEFSEGSSNKFWEVKLDDCSVYTKYGRIGSDGKVTVKEFDDDEKAQKEYDKLVKSKVKKGYAEV